MANPSAQYQGKPHVGFGRYALVALALNSACGGATSPAEVEVEAGAPCAETSDCTGGLVCGWSYHDRPNCGRPGVCVKPGCFGDEAGVCHWFGFPICGCDGQGVELTVMTTHVTPSGGTTQIDYVSAPIGDGHCYPDAGESSD